MSVVAAVIKGAMWGVAGLVCMAIYGWWAYCVGASMVW